MRTFNLGIFILFFTITVYGQYEKQHNFIHYPPESGIISHQVNTSVQDKQGFIWLGTTSGLQRFDGIRFKTFRHDEKNPSSLPSNPVWQLLIDKKNNLWMLLADGKVGIFNTSNFTFKEIPVIFKRPPSPNTFIKKIITDDEGNLFYLIAGQELITLDKNATGFSYRNNFFKLNDQWAINDFIPQAGTNKYWFAIANGGIGVYNKKTAQLSDGVNNTEHDPVINAFDKNATYTNLFFDRQQCLWVVQPGADPKISCFNTVQASFWLKNFSLYPQMKGHFEIKGFMQQKNGTIWLHGLSLLARFAEDRKSLLPIYNGYLNEHSIYYEMVHAVYEDREDNLWICTDNNGLYRFNPSHEFFTNIDRASSEDRGNGVGNTLSFIYTKWGTVLTGTRHDGLYQYDNHFNNIPVNIKGLDKRGGSSVWNMFASADSNTLWLGTEPGFYAINQLRKTAVYFNPPELKDNTVRQIVEDRHGTLWLGTQNDGLFKCAISKKDKISITSTIAVTAVPAAQINKLTLDTEGRLWVATPENGLYVMDTDTGNLWMHFGDKEENEKKLPERGISSVIQLNDSIMLISTATRLVKYNTRSAKTSLLNNAGLIAGFITAMEKDKMGYVWLTSTSGLYQIDPEKKIFTLYDRTDGLDNEHFIQSASATFPDGTILFGGTHNLIFFDPAKMKSQPSDKTVRITDIRLAGKLLNTDSVLSLRELTLGNEDKPLAIEFSPFLFSGIEVVKYKLEGLDNDWNPGDKTFQALYNYLPPGKYSLVVKAPSDLGKHPDGLVLLNIKVNRPFWQTWWFYSCLALSGIAVLFLFDRARLKRKEAVHHMRGAIADDLHREVQTTLDNISILSELARMNAEREPAKSKEFIAQISSGSQQMTAAMDDMLWSISPENDSMEKTITRLREFIDTIKIQRGVQVDLLVDNNVYDLKPDMKQRKDMYWFFKGGISSVIRSGGSDCKVHIRYEKPDLIYLLEFDKTQADLQQLNNLRGRQELEDKLTAVKAKLEVKELTTKTIFRLTIPLNTGSG